MPYMETPNDLADHLADLLGIYEDGRCSSEDGVLHDRPEGQERQHIPDCDCRVFWVPLMAQRIKDAVDTERSIREGLEDKAAGRVGPWSKVRAEMGLESAPSDVRVPCNVCAASGCGPGDQECLCGACEGTGYMASPEAGIVLEDSEEMQGGFPEGDEQRR